MRQTVICLAIAAALGCAKQGAAPHPWAPQALDGTWQLTAASSALDPRSLTLTEIAYGVTGTGTAMGVDAPITVTVTGNQVGSAVALTFTYPSGGVAHYAATFETGNQLAGEVVYDSALGGMTDSLTYVYVR